MGSDVSSLRFRALLPLFVVPLLFVLTLRSSATPAPLVRSELPDEPFVSDRCNWSCHNRGCRHAPKLPAFLTADDQLFGDAVRGLYQLGGALMPGDTFGGYGAANLLVFCALWPGGMFALWCIGLRQRDRLRARRRRAGGSVESASSGQRGPS